MKTVRVAAAVVWDGARLLMTRRPPCGPLGLKWEVPGGKIEPGESAAQALEREVQEELGVRARAGRTLGEHTHEYPHGLRVELTFIECTLESLEFSPTAAVYEVRWLEVANIPLEEVLEADREFVRSLGAHRVSGER